MATEDKSAPERKRERESTLVGRDKASAETVELLNSLRDSIDDDDAAVAVATLHAQVNGDHEAYERPPAEAPFGKHWHQEISISEPTVESTTDTTITVSAELETYQFFDGDATMTLRVRERNKIDAEPITATTTATEGDTPTLTVDGLKAGTEYSVRLFAEVVGVSEYAETLTTTTDSAQP